MQVVFTEEPQLARWEEAQQCWRTDGFENVHYAEETGTISFKTQFIGPIATFMVTELTIIINGTLSNPHTKI